MQPDVLKNVRAIFFDLDNTLIDRDQSFRNGLFQWLKNNVPDIPQHQYLASIDQIMQRDKRGHSNRYTFCEWIRRTYDLQGVSVDRIQTEFSTLIADNTVRNNEVIQLLGFLKRSHLIGIISNGSGTSQRAKIKNSGLDKVFDKNTIYIEGEVGYGKPHPSIFQLASIDHDIAPEDFLFIGDHPVNDIVGGQQAGMKTCWIRNGQSIENLSVQPDFILQTFHDWNRENVYV